MGTEGNRTGFRRIAWDKVSFFVPEDWELAMYRWPNPGHTIIELEDDFSTCLNGEWQWAGEKHSLKDFQKKIEAKNGDLAKRADHKKPIKNLPRNWSAFVYTFSHTVPDETKRNMALRRADLFHATYVTKTFSASFQIQCPPDSSHILEDLGQTFIEHFKLHTSDSIPWELFDISITLPKAFSLADAQFSVGSKHLIFNQEKRTLHLWMLSCADIILKDAESFDQWCCGYLNSQGGIRSLVFKPFVGGGVGWKRRFPMIFTHRQEIGALCFKWKVRAIHQEEDNLILIWAFNYRREADIDWLPEWLTKKN